MTELPTGTVTFLFTDLEGSTRLWEEHPETMRDALARHDEILRDAVDKQGGHVVKTTGDGLHAAFGVASDAVAAAVEAERALGSEDWRLPEPLRVRMGIHTGAAELRAGDYYGTAVNRAARLAAAAHGGQIVVSLATEQLVREDLDAEATLVDLGEHRLRDLERPERVFQLCTAGLAVEFPPLRTTDRAAGYLPRYPDEFVGRGAAVSDIVDLLGRHRLVTLTGPGGAGKSRLAVESAGRIAAEFPDGAWFVGLASVTDGALVAIAVATTLRIPETTGRPLTDVVAGALEARRLLLVLDNCEHLIDHAAAFVSVLLESCPSVHVLATSRETLGVRGEHGWAVPSLEVPAEGASDVEVIMRSEAVELFATRASETRADFAITRENAREVASVCRRLDGIPLAIELAATRVSVLTPAEIDTRLDERLRLLTAGTRAGDERHHTLRAAIDWSYELLDGAEAQLFARLSVFAGSFALDAAEAIGAGDLGLDVLEALARLVAKSLVVAEDRGGATRYRMLETLRLYAAERLAQTGELDATRRRHGEHYVERAEQIHASLFGPDEARGLDCFELELPNIRVALQWVLDAPEPDLAWRLGFAIGWPLYSRGLLADLDEMLGAVVASGGSPPPDVESRVLCDWALTAIYSGALEQWRERAQRAVDSHAATTGVPFPPAQGLLAMVLAVTGDWEHAADLARAAASSMRSLRSEVSVLDTQQTIASAAWALHAIGAATEARELAQEAVDVARANGAPGQVANAVFVQAETVAGDDAQLSLALIEEVGTIARAARIPLVERNALAGGAVYASLLGDHRRALRLASRALHLDADWAGPGPAIWQLRDIGLAAFELGYASEGATLLGAADALRARYAARSPLRDRPTGGNVSSDTQHEREAAVRALLDVPEHAAAHARGETMELREAIEFADECVERALEHPGGVSRAP